ncbi:MAG: heme exporter protein CcmD [Rhodobacteraceae bacterium]|nr:heme exporter protein CcmD [Paracoccaceae bacterium]
MPDLGKYAAEVLSAYGATCVVLCVLVAATLWQGRKVRAELAQVEKNQDGKGAQDG